MTDVLVIGPYRFESPWLLGLLLLIPLWAWLRGRYAPVAAVTYSSEQLLREASRQTRFQPRRLLVALRYLALVLLIVAIARPQREKGEVNDESKGINIMLTLDFSSSMGKKDFTLDGRKVRRLDGLKAVCTEFINSRLNDRIGLVCLSSNAFLMSPLTLDHEWLAERLRVEPISRRTALGAGLLVGAAHLRALTNEPRVQILVTDAESISAGPPIEQVADAIQPLGIKCHVIQIVDYLSLKSWNGLKDSLTRLAHRTGGQYFRVTDTAGLRSVYDQIDQLEKVEFKEKKQKSYRELFPWFVWPGIGLFLLEVMLRQTVWRRLP